MDVIKNALSWAGLDYDYGMGVSVSLVVGLFTLVIGPGKGGPHGPYFQSERLDLYHTYTKRLLDVCQLPHSRKDSQRCPNSRVMHIDVSVLPIT